MTKVLRKRAMKRISAEEFLCLEMPEGKARLVRFAYRVRHGKRQRADDMRFLAAAFDQIVAGADAKKALSIAGKRGRHKLTAREADERLRYAVAVEQYRAAGMKKPDAIARVAQEFNLAVQTIEGHHKRDGGLIRSLFRFGGVKK